MTQGATANDYQSVIEQQAATICKLEQELDLFKFKFEQLQQHVFGKRSEKSFPTSPNQGQLFESKPVLKPEGDEYTEIKTHKRKRNSKKSIPELPVVEIVYEPSESHCADCGSELKEFSRDVREEVEFEPARFFKCCHVTVHCSCSCNKVHSGKAASAIIPGSQTGPGFLAQLVVAKFCDHLPYYRQSQMYVREGVFYPDKALSRYGLRVAELLEPIAKAIKAELLNKNYLQADETPLEVLDTEKSSNIHKGQLWVLNDPLSPLVYYEYKQSRSTEAANQLLDGFKGTLQTDALASYNEHAGIRIGCMAHARRYFVKAEKLASKECKHVLKLIGALYKIEKDLKKQREKDKDQEWYKLRALTRAKNSVPILDDLFKYLAKLKDRWLLEEHPMYKAINYMLSRYDSFTLYTTDGRYEIDNNPVERAIRPVAIGRRNWLFSGSHHGADMAAVLITVIQTCKQLKINPQRYIADVLPKLADSNTTSLRGFTPMDWNQE